jgi:hypothetical protein
MVLIILETKGENFMHLHYTPEASLFNDTMVATHIKPRFSSLARSKASCKKTRVNRSKVSKGEEERLERQRKSIKKWNTTIKQFIFIPHSHQNNKGER